MRISRRIALASAGLALFSASSFAESWPQRTVRLIVPVPAGSGGDFAARLFADRLSRRWHQPVIVDNRPGADSVIGVAAFLAADDDHTLLFAISAVVTVHPLTKKLPYDPVRELVPISSASDVILAIAASDKTPIHSLAELEQAARTRPGQINWTSSPGLPPFVVGGFFKKSGLDLVSVPYRDLAPALEDLREGRIGIMVHALGVLLPQVQGAKARLLAVANRDRAAIAPDAPTVVEAGYPELRMDGLLGFYGRRGMPAERRDRIAADIRAIADEPAIQERLAPVAQAPRGSTPVEFAALLQQLRERISVLAKATGYETAQ